MQKNKIIPQMFDVRPVNEAGDLDWEKIKKIDKISEIGKSRTGNKKIYIPMAEVRPPVLADSEEYSEIEVPVEFEIPNQTKVKKSFEKHFPSGGNSYFAGKASFEDFPVEERISQFPDFKIPRRKIEIDITALVKILKAAKIAAPFASAALGITLFIAIPSMAVKKFNLKSEILGASRQGFTNIASAVENVKKENFEASSVDFGEAYDNFSQASQDLDKIGSVLIGATKYFPYLSQLSSGKNATEAGKHIALAGKSLNEVIKLTYSLKNSLNNGNQESISFLEVFRSTESNLKTVNEELSKAEINIREIKIDDLPDDKKEEFLVLKNKLPVITKTIGEFLNNEHIFTDLLGGNGPRKYLFLFQNNQEMRATGGFIGSYALLDIANGRVKKFFIDEIFNPDGQLKEKIVPPMPIQKMSAAWSLHDSNWFPDFPASAEKAISFYEKTGGPTVDGVITLTPTVMEKLLEITSPVEMKDYNTVLDSENFIAQTQYEVEVDYNKEENRPKKILSDLAPIVLDKIFNAGDFKNISRAIQVLSKELKEKQILIYSRNYDLQKIISSQGWSGEVLNTPNDYLSVINTNISGYKTDGVIDEKIEHLAEIQADGGVVDTVTVTRKHNGGNSEYDWWNKVNADYMRIYVPRGSKLLEVSGQTREFNNEPLDYNALGFKRDPQVEMEEENMIIDASSGTRIYEDSGKTVFANWVYVSPQETVTVKYKYLLPFKILTGDKTKPADTYSLLAQKQSGSIGSSFASKITYPDSFNVIWKYPDEISNEKGNLEYATDLKTDKFVGAAFVKK